MGSYHLNVIHARMVYIQILKELSNVNSATRLTFSMMEIADPVILFMISHLKITSLVRCLQNALVSLWIALSKIILKSNSLLPQLRTQ